MKKKLMPTVLALAILVILLVYANYFETEEILPPGAQKPEPILKCQAGEITSMTWNPVDGQQVKLLINASDSRIVVPADLRCDKNEVEGLTRHFAELMAEMTVAESVTEGSNYGLDNAAPTVTIEAAGKSTRLTLGNKTEVGGSYYLAKEGDPRVFSVPGYIQPAFFKKLEDLRDRQLFSEDFGQVNSITLKTGGEEIELVMNDSFSEWSITRPASYSADGVAIADILQRMRNLRVSRFVDDNPVPEQDYGFASEPFRITVSNKNGRSFVLETGAIAGTETHARVTGQKAVHMVLNSDVNELKKTVHDLREKYLVTPPFTDITELTVVDASGSIVIEKKDGGWWVGVQKVEEGDIKAFVSSIGQAKILAFLEEKHKEELGLKNRDACSTISIKTADSRLKLWLGSRQGANIGLLSETEIMEISAEIDEAFKKLMYQLRQPFAENQASQATQPGSATSSVENKPAELPPVEQSEIAPAPVAVETPSGNAGQVIPEPAAAAISTDALIIPPGD